jgi:hypothetical protein
VFNDDYFWDIFGSFLLKYEASAGGIYSHFLVSRGRRRGCSSEASRRPRRPKNELQLLALCSGDQSYLEDVTRRDPHVAPRFSVKIYISGGIFFCMKADRNKAGLYSRKMQP